MPWGLVPAAFKEAGLVFVSPSGHQATRLGLTWSLVESVVHHGGTEFDHPGWKNLCMPGWEERTVVELPNPRRLEGFSDHILEVTS